METGFCTCVHRSNHMIDLLAETLIPFSQAARELPGRPHRATLHRWRSRGVRGVKLETCLVGGRRFTSYEAIKRFSVEVTAASDGLPPPALTPRAGRDASAVA